MKVLASVCLFSGNSTFTFGELLLLHVVLVVINHSAPDSSPMTVRPRLANDSVIFLGIHELNQVWALDLPGSRNPTAFTSVVAWAIGMHHHTWLIFFFLRRDPTMLPRLGQSPLPELLQLDLEGWFYVVTLHGEL